MTTDTDLGLVCEGVIATVEYHSTQGTAKTIEAEVEDISEEREGYRFELTVDQNGEEKRRRISVDGRRRRFSVHAYDRNTRSNWRRIGRGDAEDIAFDLRLGGWEQHADSTLRWYHSEDGRELYLVQPADSDTYEIVVDREVLDLDPIADREEALDTAEALMNYKY